MQQLAAPVRRWNRELQAMSPPTLARCLSCSDVTIGRLQQLVDIGAGGSARLPPINKILTQPTPWWEASFAAVAAAKEKAAEQHAADVASDAEEAEVGVTVGAEHHTAEVRGSSLGGTQAAARAALTKVRTTTGSALAQQWQGGGAGSVSSTQSVEDEERGESEGLLAADASWRSSLTDALLGAASDIQARWLQKPAKAADGSSSAAGQKEGAEQQQEAAAAAATSSGDGSRFRRRR